jgi:EpsI family protein
MLKVRGSIRLWTTVAVLLCALMCLHTVSHGEAIVPRQPLSELSYSLSDWTGVEQPLQGRIVQAVGVSDYTNRIYVNQAGAKVLLYVGYYATQKTGDTIHSPKNCLPGAGWDPIRSEYATIAMADGSSIVVNEYVIQRDENRDLVLYWYQGRGRIIASEYWGKFWMIADAVSRNRTDGALVRLVTPIMNSEPEARARLVDFTRTMFPHLEALIPN